MDFLSGKRFGRFRLWSVFLLLAACNGPAENRSDPVARVYQSHLSQSDLAGLVPSGASAEDSVQMVKEYIDNWVRREVILYQAEENLPEEEQNIGRLLEDYRKTLMIYTYEQELIKQRLDTSVGADEIEEYFKKNQELFLLKDYIVKVLYVKLDARSQHREQVADWYRLEKQEDVFRLLELATQFSENYYYDSESWIYFDDLIREVPLRTYNKEDFLRKNKYLSFEEDGYLYFLHILDYKLKDNISPLDLERANIRSQIINRRKRELIEEMRNALYTDAVDRNNVEWYE